MGSRNKAQFNCSDSPIEGSGAEPQPTTHFRASYGNYSDSFDMLREIFQHTKQRAFYQELVIFAITGIASIIPYRPTLSKWEVL